MTRTNYSWTGRPQAKTQWSQGKQIRVRHPREREVQRAGVTDDADVHKPEKLQDQAHVKAVLSLFTWRSRFLDAKDQLILWFVSYILRGRGGGEALTKEKEEMLDQAVISPYYQRRSVKCTHCLVFHAGENHIQHLGEGGFGRGLVDEVFTGQIDVVTRSHSL